MTTRAKAQHQTDTKRVVVGYSGGVTSAWCLAWALQRYPRTDVVALYHDTKREDADTYRYLHEMADRLGIAITERSDGRSVEDVEDDEGAIANNRMAFCSRILKTEQKDKYFAELRAAGISEIVSVLGFSAHEEQRVQRATARAWAGRYVVRFPLIETGTTKQQCVDWSHGLGVRVPAMYAWSDHANCVGCRRGGKAYWLAVKRERPDVFEAMKQREAEKGHTVLKIPLAELERVGLKREVRRREAIDIGPCECGA